MTTTRSADLVRINVDQTVFGDSKVIETRLPRSVFGRVQVGDDGLVYDDSVEPRRFQVAALLNDGRDVGLVPA